MMTEEMNERLRSFYKNKTYCYIKDVFDYNFNGYIIKINKNEIIFKDDLLNEIPIFIKNIQLLTYSNKNNKKEEKNGNSDS